VHHVVWLPARSYVPVLPLFWYWLQNLYKLLCFVFFPVSHLIIPALRGQCQNWILLVPTSIFRYSMHVCAIYCHMFGVRSECVYAIRFTETVKTGMLSQNETPLILALFLLPDLIWNKLRLRENIRDLFLATKRRTKVIDVLMWIFILHLQSESSARASKLVEHHYSFVVERVITPEEAMGRNTGADFTRNWDKTELRVFLFRPAKHETPRLYCIVQCVSPVWNQQRPVLVSISVSFRSFDYDPAVQSAFCASSTFLHASVAAEGW